MTNPSPSIQPDSKIIDFLNSNSVVSIATSVGGQPYSASCYYAFVEGETYLAFKSDSDTRHIEEALQNNKVSGTILPDKIVKAKPQGIQFTGTFMKAEGEVGKKAKETYLRKYPVAGIFRGEIWMIEIEHIKFTDNTLLFGKKLFWER